MDNPYPVETKTEKDPGRAMTSEEHSRNATDRTERSHDVRETAYSREYRETQQEMSKLRDYYNQQVKDLTDAQRSLQAERQSKREIEMQLNETDRVLRSTKEMNRQVTDERNGLMDIRKRLQDKEQELQVARDQHQQAMAELQEQEEQVNDFRIRWRQTAGELNKIRSEGQGFYQVTDQELVQKVTQLRFNIRSLAYQHFGEEVADVRSKPELLGTLGLSLGVALAALESHMRDPSLRPAVVGAFIWDFLVKEVFGEFRWINKESSDGMTIMTRLLKPDGNAESQPSPEATRKFQMWKASTSTLLMDATQMTLADGPEGDRRFLDNEVKSICKYLILFSKSKDRDLNGQVFDIVKEAVELDKLISKQVAELQWLTLERNESRHLNAETMNVEQGKKPTDASQSVFLVLAPGLIKRGKSTGEDFDVQYILLKMEVSCGEATTFGPPVEAQKQDKPDKGAKSFSNHRLWQARNILGGKK